MGDDTVIAVPFLLALSVASPAAAELAPTWSASVPYPAGSIVTYDGRPWRTEAEVPCGCAPLGSGDGSKVDRDLLLRRRAGFGRLATGGYDGPIHHVTTDADSGPGSLREAVTRPEPLWIVFDGDYTITLRSGLPVASNKTIDGRGRRVTLTGHGQPGLIVSAQANVIIENLTLRDFGDITRTKFNDRPDAILLDSGAHTIWIDHCSLSMAGDKLVAVNGGATDITVSWCRFTEQEQVFQVGAMATKDQDVNTRLTSHHNFFDATGYRHPVVSYGKVHAYNNYLRAWRNYGMRAERTGQLYSEANIFEAGDNRAAVRFDTPGNGWNDPHTLFDDRPGFVKSVGDLKLNRAQVRTREPELVFTPSIYYSYRADVADEALKALVAAYAGVEGGRWVQMAAGTERQ